MKYRKDDLIGIRKARFASFVLLLVCFAAMLVILVLSAGGLYAYIASAAVIAVLVFCWWFAHRSILFGEAAFFEAFTRDMREVYRRLRMLEAAVKQIPDGIVIVADESDMVFVNEAAKNLLAAFDGDLDRVRYDEYAAVFSKKLEIDAIIEAAKTGRPSETITVDGQFYKIGYIELLHENGKSRGAVAVISDVTENTKVERMQSDFVANVSHELKTPLAIVKGYAETLLAGGVEDEGTKQEFLDMTVSEVDNMDNMIKELLYLARVDLKGPQPDKSMNEMSELKTLVRMSMKKLDIVAGRKSLTVNQMFANKPGISIEMDRDLIERVILNVLENAIKYTDEKGRVDVDIIPGQNCVQIVISDNGAGIPEEDLPHVFDRFFRGNKARTGRESGTGLGLAISKQIVDDHGGTISIESKHRRGTTVTISLPAGKKRGQAGIL